MTLGRGARLGALEIVGELGSGGMGIVYRARDTKLDRDVAVKILPEEFATDPERMKRFEREAHVLASLHHANIAEMYELAHVGPRRALVMELVEGPTLSDLLAQEPITPVQALAIAHQVALALEYAHAQGIVHRDLKPANIKIRADGVVKVLDFGLARAVGKDVALANANGRAPQITDLATHTGVILGTATYMSPEQARGKPVDRRADIWAFGCVLYEMLAGRRVFDGETMSDTLAATLTADPDWSALPPETSSRLRLLLRRCLAKDPRQRLHAIADARFEIEEALTPGSGEDDADPKAGRPHARRASRRAKLAWALLGTVLAASVAVGLGVTGTWQRRVLVAVRPLRLSILPTGETLVANPAISPDGRRIAYPARRPDGPSMLWVRDLDAFVARPLDGTEGADQPFWSPDSKNLGFFAWGSLKRIPADGGPVQVLFGDCRGAGGAWAPDGTILFSTEEQELLRISAEGGEARPATILQGKDWNHLWPNFLPDGRRFLFTARLSTRSAEASRQGIYLGSLDSPEILQLLPDLSDAHYAAPGYIVFSRDKKVTAAGFDSVTGTLTGEIRSLGETMVASFVNSETTISVAADGTLALWYWPYCLQTGSGECPYDWQFVDRGGTSTPLPGHRTGLPTGLAPDGRRLAVTTVSVRGGTLGLSLFDIRTGSQRLLVPTEGWVGSPAWSPDGLRLAYAKKEPGQLDRVFIKDLRTGEDTLLLQDPSVSYQPTAWSHDGKHLLVAGVRRTSTELLSWSFASRTLTPFVEGKVLYWSPGWQFAVFSPDDRFVAFTSTESGRAEVYVTTFPERRQTWPLTTKGGIALSWRADGREILVATPSGQIAAFPVSTQDGFTAGPRAILLRRDLELAAPYTTMATPDHSRLLVLVIPDVAKHPDDVRLLFDWASALRPKRRTTSR